MSAGTRTLLATLAALLLLVGCTGGSATDPRQDERSSGQFVISAGNRNGVYDAYATELAAELQERSAVRMLVLESGGSIDNLENLAAGRADLAFSAVDAAADAVAGRGAFTEPLQIRALARVYDDFAHLVVLEDSEIRTVEDLRGRTVSVGSPRSGTALIARRLLEVAEIDESEYRAEELSLDESITRLRSGRIDAFFWSGGLRTPAITDLAGRSPIRLVPLGELVDGVRARYGSGYRHGTVPAGTYVRSGGVETLAVPNVLVVRSDLSEDLAHELVSTLFAAQSGIAPRVSAASALDRTKAIFTDPVELHLGAMTYYRETKD